MQGLEKTIYERYGLNIKHIKPFKDTYILSTQQGKKILKKSFFFPERIFFVHGAKEHLIKNNFVNIDKYCSTIDGEPYFHYEGNNYTISDAVEGRECDFNSRNDIKCASRMLAHLHKASKGYAPDERSRPCDELGKLPMYFNKRLTEIRRLKKIAKKGKSSFDHLFLKYVDYFYQVGENVLKQILESGYSRVVEKTKESGMFCHHDFNYNNIIFSSDNISIINFDYCCFDLKVYDITNFLRRKMRKCRWNINEAGIILEEYRLVENIDKDEFIIMKLMLQFPQKFWRVANRFYNSKRSWAEKHFIKKLEEVVEEIKYHERFMELIDSLM
jgi:CotS family spore coat protein